MDNKEIFSINLKRLMEQKGVSRQDLSKVLGVSYFTISDWVNGKKYPRMDRDLKKSIKLFFMCGLSTIFWGVMFGGYFGDAVNIISRNFFGREVSIPALWFVPLNEPMRMLLWSMIFGMIHMYTGLALKAYICIKNKRYMDALCDVGFWAILLTGLILIPVFFYTINGIFGKTPDFINIAIFFISAAIAFIIEALLFKEYHLCKAPFIAFLSVCFISFLFIIFNTHIIT